MDKTFEVGTEWIKLEGGPVDGSYIMVPRGSFGDIIIHNTPMEVDSWHDIAGVLHQGVRMDSAQSLGRAVRYFRGDKDCQCATYDETHHNPSDESQDWDLPVTHPYLEGDSAGGRA